MSSNPIGIFDSGVGGLSVWKELIETLPRESIIYYADSENCPYGPKSKEEIISLSKRIVEFFISREVKLVVVACNTATAAAIDYLRDNYEIPFVGMEPAIKPAALRTQTGVVGVLATEGTFGGRLYLETSEKWASDIEVEIQVGEGFVELVERGDFTSSFAFKIVKQAIKPLLDKGIDQLVLACTHYPFLIEIINSVTNGRKLELINPAPAIANQAGNLITINKLSNEAQELPYYDFYSSGDLTVLKTLVEKINSEKDCNFEQLDL